QSHAKVVDFSSVGDLARKFNSDPEILDGQKEGRVTVYRNPDGSGRIAIVPHDSLNDYMKDDWTPIMEEPDPAHPGQLIHKALPKVPGGSQTVRDRQAAEAKLELENSQARMKASEFKINADRYRGEAQERAARISLLQDEKTLKKFQIDAAQWAADW